MSRRPRQSQETRIARALSTMAPGGRIPSESPLVRHTGQVLIQRQGGGMGGEPEYITDPPQGDYTPAAAYVDMVQSAADGTITLPALDSGESAALALVVSRSATLPSTPLGWVSLGSGTDSGGGYDGQMSWRALKCDDASVGPALTISTGPLPDDAWRSRAMFCYLYPAEAGSFGGSWSLTIGAASTAGTCGFALPPGGSDLHWQTAAISNYYLGSTNPQNLVVMPSLSAATAVYARDILSISAGDFVTQFEGAPLTDAGGVLTYTGLGAFDYVGARPVCFGWSA